MIRLNRTTEYGLIALRHMCRKRDERDDSITSAREIADSYGLPFEITAKTLQRLKDTGLIRSAQGARGGYTLGPTVGEVSLADFLSMMEGPQSIVACAGASPVSSASNAVSPAGPVGGDEAACGYHTRCGIKSVMSGLNHRVHAFLSSIRLTEITEAPAEPVPQTVQWIQSFDAHGTPLRSEQPRSFGEEP